MDVAMELRGHPDQARVARECVRDMLKGTPRVDDAVSIVSELVANALTHTFSGQEGGTFHLMVTGRPDPLTGWCRIAVRDAGRAPRAEAVPTCEELAENGRGTLIVTTLAERFGAQSSPTGSMYWAEVHWGEHPDDAA